MFYFAYGSNMLRARLEQRVGAVSVVGVGCVPAYQLRFHKRSVDGSGKCNLLYTGRLIDNAHGVVYAMRLSQRVQLDKYEGRSYEAQTVIVQVGSRHVRALTYIARPEHIEEGMSPYDWYHAFVLAGAREHGLDPRHIEAIANTHALRDPNMQRAIQNERLLRFAATKLNNSD